MSFRRTFNEQEGWHLLVQENQALLSELPAGALVNKNAFRGYVTRGVHREIALTPSVFEISSKARADLFEFIHGEAHFDMEAASFDHFNDAFRSNHA
jgi:hypothetical protein